MKPVLADKVRLVFYKGITRKETLAAAAIIRELEKEQTGGEREGKSS